MLTHLLRLPLYTSIILFTVLIIWRALFKVNKNLLECVQNSISDVVLLN